jgi:DNA topoisomerase I
LLIIKITDHGLIKMKTNTSNNAGEYPLPKSSDRGEGFFYEVSRRPKNRRQKLFASAGSKLVTPSGSRVPPAWTNLWLTSDAKSPIQAIGRDSKGRRVYLYSAEQMGRASAAKFTRLKAFAKAYPALVRKMGLDKKTSEEALVLYLISKTGFRIGSDAETLAEVKAFGASTLRCSHVAVAGKSILFEFAGKKGSKVSKTLKDSFLADNIARRCTGPSDQKIFKTNDENIRQYLNSIPEGAMFTVKDFRTYLATLIALRKIKVMPAPKNSREYKRFRKEVGEAVARELGNTPNIALKSYVSPEVFCSWVDGQTQEMKNSRTKTAPLANEFLHCVHYDLEVPLEECNDSDPLERDC